MAETIELVKIRTLQFAKRQLTWFRRQLPVNWIACGAQEAAEELAERIMKGNYNWRSLFVIHT